MIECDLYFETETTFVFVLSILFLQIKERNISSANMFTVDPSAITEANISSKPLYCHKKVEILTLTPKGKPEITGI